ncbi:hypothetical protein QWZ14_16750 [Paeniroseomonas aquatica]|uniref:Relaxase/mobilization nuclease domain-containing protein n=1 Tax=Paeniroseomonas aquatica TaxID=373043 RepID=A0ABT8A8J3_9PROT|nr:hypothetical protein [Paeniroseomonas aquatica]MDN3566020.1 hypothetical protein [Paeniroseomonas aquatica]
MFSGAERGSGGPRLRRHLLNSTANEQVVVGRGRNLVCEDLGHQLDEMRLNGGACRTQRTLYHIHLDPDPLWSEEARHQGEALFWAKFEREFGLQSAAYSEVRHLKHGRWHAHRVYDLAGGNRRIAEMSFDRYRRQRLSAEVAYELGQDCPSIAHPRKVIDELRKMGRDDIADFVRDTWRKAPDPDRDDLMPKASRRRRDGIDPETAPFVAAAISPKRRMQRDRTKVEPMDVGAVALAALRSGDSGPARVAALRDAGLPVYLGDKANRQGERVPVLMDESRNVHPLLRTINAALRARGEKPLVKADLIRLLAGAEIAPLPAAGARATPARKLKATPARQPEAISETALVDLDDIEPEAIRAAADAMKAASVDLDNVGPETIQAAAEAMEASKAAGPNPYVDGHTFDGAWRVAFGVPGYQQPQVAPRATIKEAPGSVEEAPRAAKATTPPPAAVTPHLAAASPPAIGANLYSADWEAESWWASVIAQLRRWLRGEEDTPRLVERPGLTPQPTAIIPDNAALLAFIHYDDADRWVLTSRLQRVFGNAGLTNPAEAAVLLVQLRQGTIARPWTPATNFTPRQHHALQVRLAELVALEQRITNAPPPAVAPIDKLWLQHCQMRHAALMRRTEGDLAKARGALDAARAVGDRQGIRRWESALSILANERHRLEHRLRYDRTGKRVDQAWQTLQSDVAEAPGLLHELRQRQLAGLRDERARVAAAIRASAPMPPPDHRSTQRPNDDDTSDAKPR